MQEKCSRLVDNLPIDLGRLPFKGLPSTHKPNNCLKLTKDERNSIPVDEDLVVKDCNQGMNEEKELYDKYRTTSLEALLLDIELGIDPVANLMRYYTWKMLR
ncbi:conserved hypothetical protein [Ricinus communis]|uniref:Uncharacterized protein n=1 Tax=Ricinus communis TaxID=3988 RepID=B9STS2_RICCO|nr:conserved hypothetical protein [Ricinus communis]